MDLCNILEISVNDLLSGEKIAKEQYDDKVDENLIKLQKLPFMVAHTVYCSNVWREANG